MKISASKQQIVASAASPEQPIAIGLDPEVLLRAGILSNPENPAQALRRAKGLVQHGRFREARGLVQPHLRNANGELRLQMTELLARCAMNGANGDWESLLRFALDCHQLAGNTLGAARAQRFLGEMYLAVGRLQDADEQLEAAASGFRAAGDEPRAAVCTMLRARVLLSMGFVSKALERIDAAVAVLERSASGRHLAMARLERARILAHRGETAGAARDLVAAERYLGASGGALDRVRARITRAECLCLMGEARRAANGLKRILVDVVDLEEVGMRAWVHALLGQALMDLDPASARQALMRGRHIYAGAGHAYYVAQCDIALARVEHRIGLNPRARIKQLRQAPLDKWPVLAAQLNVLRAEITAHSEPERARLALFRARAFAVDGGDGSLARDVDQVLCAAGLVTADEAERLTPVNGASSLPLVLAGAGAVLAAHRPQPVPYTISDITDRQVVISSRAREAWRFVGRDTQPMSALQPPKAVGVRRPS